MNFTWFCNFRSAASARAYVRGRHKKVELQTGPPLLGVPPADDYTNGPNPTAQESSRFTGVYRRFKNETPPR